MRVVGGWPRVVMGLAYVATCGFTRHMFIYLFLFIFGGIEILLPEPCDMLGRLGAIILLDVELGR